LYGELPYEEYKPRVLFEKPKRDVLHIHEWYNNEYKKFEKIGKNRKQLIEKHSRKKKSNGGFVSLLDFVK